MSEDKRKFFSADSLERAVLQAASHFGIDPDRVAYEKVEKKGMTRSGRKFLIEVDVTRPEREAGVPQPAPGLAPAVSRPAPVGGRPREERPAAAGRSDARRPGPRGREDRGGSHGGRGDRGGRGDSGGRGDRGARDGRRREEDARRPKIESVATELVPLLEVPRQISERFPAAEGLAATTAREEAARLLSIAGARLDANVFQGDGELLVDLAGPDADICFRDSGELLHSLEHLLPRLIRSRTGEAVACRVDCDNFHEIREEQLRSLAQRVAAEVVRGGAPKILEPMNPADRRAVHMALADDATVMTESEGDGYFKRVVVRGV
ncbi:MAG: R3H domain-containing nucleic acid-binding protein [Acidobacteriota bacterium]